MPTVDPATYAWLSGSLLEVAGCVTVVPDPDRAAVAKAFGNEPAEVGGDGTFSDRADLGELGDGTEIGVATSPSATAVFELNGFEGTRAEVLREASKVGSAKSAASLYWNVNGAVRMTCARRGKVVASVELPPYDEDEISELPRALRALARRTLDDGADLLAIGAAMVETYTGAGFTEADLSGAVVLPIVSRPADLTTFRHDSSFRPLDDAVPGAQDAVHAMPPEHQRALAAWAATAAVREAGLADEPAVRAVLDECGAGVPTSLPPGIEAMKRRATAESDRQQKRVDETYDESAIGALAQYHAWLPGHALTSLSYTSHADPYSAAVGALAAAAAAFGCTRLDRGARFVEDRNGRHFDGLDQSPRLREFADVVRRVIDADPAQWDDLADALPAPLSVDELAAAADRDRRLQEAGAFATWQTGAGWSLSGDDGADEDDDDPVVDDDDFEAGVMARYRELERRDRALAERGPIAVEVLPPENPGGFAVLLSDGVRIERLPGGRVGDSLFLAFVFTSEFDLDLVTSRRGWGLFDRVAYEGPEGPIRSGGSGSGNGSLQHWHTRIEVADQPWIRVRYLEGGRVVASETIELT